MKTSPNASTVSAEYQRQDKQHTSKSMFKSLQQKQGIVTEVHSKLPMVKVRFANGADAAGGAFIPVAHSVMDILQRFGALRPGLRVLVTFAGELEAQANVTIIGIEDEKLGAELQQDNQMQTPLYSIFPPGSGL